MAVYVHMKLNEKLYLRDPLSSDLGRRIIVNGSLLIDKLGFEDFTFKKLAIAIDSTEASVYRYFENKHNLLVYLASWYWSWLDYQITQNTKNIPDPLARLDEVIRVLSRSATDDPDTLLDERVLHRIITAEFPKAYHTKEVDDLNKAGFFLNYKSLCKSIAALISEAAPGHPWPRMVASSLVEAAHKNIFYAEHLPSLTDLTGNDTEPLRNMLRFFLYSLIGIRP